MSDCTGNTSEPSREPPVHYGWEDGAPPYWRRKGRSTSRGRTLKVMDRKVPGQSSTQSSDDDQASANWGAGLEPYPAALVLDDLDERGGDPDAATVILARFAILQLALIADAGLIAETELAADLLLAEEYLTVREPFRAGEDLALEGILDLVPDLSRSVARPALAHALLEAGAAAEGWGHSHGARALYQTAHGLAQREGWESELGDAATALTALTADSNFD